MTDWPPHLQEVPFDHDAVFRAEWAVNEAVARLDWAAANRSRLMQDTACWCEGPFVQHLGAEVAKSVAEAGWLADRLRALRARLRDAREQAFRDQVRLEVARSDWLASQEQAAAQLLLAEGPA